VDGTSSEALATAHDRPIPDHVRSREVRPPRPGACQSMRRRDFSSIHGVGRATSLRLCTVYNGQGKAADNPGRAMASSGIVAAASAPAVWRLVGPKKQAFRPLPTARGGR
jgi:hypothetical protein